MGQQQLLLLVLGIVIVGLAVVVGIQAFSENQQKANLDAMVNDGVSIASDLQAWSLKPHAFGGPSDEDYSPWLTGTFNELGYELGGNNCRVNEFGNLNGCFALAGGVLFGYGHPTGLRDARFDNRVRIKVSGPRPGDIEVQTSTNGLMPE